MKIGVQSSNTAKFGVEDYPSFRGDGGQLMTRLVDNTKKPHDAEIHIFVFRNLREIIDECSESGDATTRFL